MNTKDFLATLTTTTAKREALASVFKTFTPKELNGILGKVQSGENEGQPRGSYALRNGGAAPVAVPAGDNVNEYRLSVQRARTKVGAVDVKSLIETHTVTMAEKLVAAGTFESIEDALTALNTVG